MRENCCLDRIWIRHFRCCKPTSEKPCALLAVTVTLVMCSLYCELSAAARAGLPARPSASLDLEGKERQFKVYVLTTTVFPQTIVRSWVSKPTDRSAESLHLSDYFFMYFQGVPPLVRTRAPCRGCACCALTAGEGWMRSCCAPLISSVEG